MIREKTIPAKPVLNKKPFSILIDLVVFVLKSFFGDCHPHFLLIRTCERFEIELRSLENVIW
jgi:hypothetical protein